MKKYFSLCFFPRPLLDLTEIRSKKKLKETILLENIQLQYEMIFICFHIVPHYFLNNSNFDQAKIKQVFLRLSSYYHSICEKKLCHYKYEYIMLCSQIYKIQGIHQYWTHCLLYKTHRTFKNDLSSIFSILIMQFRVFVMF